VRPTFDALFRPANAAHFEQLADASLNQDPFAWWALLDELIIWRAQIFGCC
jgi:hypothetical protein